MNLRFLYENKEALMFIAGIIVIFLVIFLIKKIWQLF